ncbi:MAG: FAD:protein FMN transferase, partial [Thermoguttaceae bacterium]
MPAIPPSEPENQELGPLLVVSRKAMGGEFEVSFSGNDFPLGTAAALDSLDEVERLEKQFSVFIPESRISFINKVAAYDQVRLTDELFELIRFALKTSE